MKEDFLHYLWQYKKFDVSALKTVQGESLIIVHSGSNLQNQGPDFFNAQILLDGQKWAGNVEIHVKASDWYLHHHESDSNYDNVILHVVWEYDTPVFRKNNVEISVLEIKNYVAKEALEQYFNLTSKKNWIYCENQLKDVDLFILKNFQEKLFFERLERKSIIIDELLKETENDWEAVMFCVLAKNFGLNTNGNSFLKMAQSIPFSVVRKESFEVENLEALFLGTLDLLPKHPEEEYGKKLKQQFSYILQKHQLPKVFIEPVTFFKHRPDNFPTIRLALLAMLYHQRQNLFSQLISVSNKNDFYRIFNLSVSKYWETHYQIDKISPQKTKLFSKSFIDLLIINAIVPLQFAYAKSKGIEISEHILELLSEVALERNAIIEKFQEVGVKVANAFDSQSLLQLKNEYCNKNKCLKCTIGIQLLNQ